MHVYTVYVCREGDDEFKEHSNLVPGYQEDHGSIALRFLEDRKADLSIGDRLLVRGPVAIGPDNSPLAGWVLPTIVTFQIEWDLVPVTA